MPEDLPKPEATATVPATSFPKFRQLPRELQLMVWEIHLETRSAVRHCFNMGTFGRTYAVMNLAQHTLQPVVLARKKDPDHLWVDPLFQILEQNKVML